MNSPKLSQWLSAQKRRKENAVLIEQSLLSGKMGRYYLFRYRYFAIKSLLSLLIAAIQIKILVTGFGTPALALQALGASAFATLLVTLWWSGLETMRSEIRKQKRSENGGILIPQILLEWKRITKGITLKFAGISLTCLLLFIASKKPLTVTPLDFYLLALIIRILAEIPLRAFHSCVYATRRIYKPLPWILGIEALGFACFVLLTPHFGAWSVGISTLLVTAINFRVSWHFIEKMYRHMGYEKAVKILETRPRLPYPTPSPKEFLREALPLTLFRLDGILILATALTQTQTIGTSTATLYLLALCLPLLHTCQEWAQLLYFDYKKLEIDYMSALLTRFERGGRLMPLTLALSLWGLLPLGVWFLTQKWSLPPWQTLALLFSAALLSKSTIKTFSLGNKTTLLKCGILLALSLTLLFAFPLPFETSALAMSLLLLNCHILLNWKFTPRPPREIPRSLLPLGPWLERAKKTQKPLQAGWIRLKKGEMSPYHLKTSLAKGIKKLLQKQNQLNSPIFFTSLNPLELLYFTENTEPNLLTLLKTAGGPHIDRIVHKSASAQSLPAELSPYEPLLKHAQIAPPPWRHTLLPLAFFLSPKSINSYPLSPKDSQEILHGAKETYLKAAEPKKWDPWDVTIEETQGRIQTIYAFSQKTPWPIRQEWRKTLLKKNIYTSWQEKEKNPPPPQNIPKEKRPNTNPQKKKKKQRKPWSNTPKNPKSKNP